MGTDFIDRDLMSAASSRRADSPPRPRRAAPRPEDRQAELAALQEREAALEAERAALTALADKQSAYSSLRDALEADLSAALDRVSNAHVTLATVLQIADEAENELHDIDARIAEIQEDRWDESRLAEELDSATATLSELRDAYDNVAVKLADAESAGAEARLSSSPPSRSLRTLFSSLSPRARDGWAWALGAALPILGVALLISLAWWLFLLWWW
jgi:hypothetical protein